MTSPFSPPEYPPVRVLIVDDDVALCDLLTQYLTRRNFQVESAEDGLQGLKRAQEQHYDLIVLDVLLPQLDGFEVLRRLRRGSEQNSYVPVLMLTAHGDEVDRIVGLELGADDYLSKPFNTRELLARMRAILRRAALVPPGFQALSPIETSTVSEAQTTAAQEALPSRPLLRVSDVQVDYGARVVQRAGETLKLTATEFELLVLLLQTANVVVTREQIAREILQRELMPFDRSLDMHISKLRRKIGPYPSGAERIKTVRGIGFIYGLDE